jgi:dTDP-4-amino-4,6-dideoxygalactose transaminase
MTLLLSSEKSWTDREKMTDTLVDFNKPCIVGKEYDYMADSIRSSHISGDGKYSKLCHELLERTLGVPKVLTTPSCSHALELTALLLDIKPGDEVIIPDFTFVSTVNAFVLRGATPVFIDVRPDTLNMDESRLEALITTKTKAIVPVHYAGIACEMDTIMDIANRHGIPVVEDNAHGLFGKYKNRWLGTIGCMATQSFHETKNFTCGEGGAILINDRSRINTPGCLLAQVYYFQISWPDSFMPSWKYGKRFRQNANGSGRHMNKNLPPGPRRTGLFDLLFRMALIHPGIFIIYCFQIWSNARG